MKSRLLSFFALLPALQNGFHFGGTNCFPVASHVHAAQPMGGRTAGWRFFGCDEAGVAENRDLQRQ
jgi:hypothetical protein